MSLELFKKLRLQEGQRALILNAPEAYIDKLFSLPDGVELIAVSETPEADTRLTPEENAFDFVQLFVKSTAEIENRAPYALKAAKPDAMLWFCYPKGSSKIKTDINRDTGWNVVSESGFEGVAMVSIDDTWSAMRFRPLNAITSARKTRTSPREKPIKAPADRVVIVPDDLAAAFKESPTAASFYETLSYTNKKEYVRWITEAKREETRTGRILKTVEKLENGIKNPSMKKA